MPPGADLPLYTGDPWSHTRGVTPGRAFIHKRLQPLLTSLLPMDLTLKNQAQTSQEPVDGPREVVNTSEYTAPDSAGPGTGVPCPQPA